MNREEIKKIAKEEFINNVMKNVDSALIFTYISNLEVESKRLNNIINEMEKFFKYEFDNEVRPLNDRKISVWTICLDKLKELKGEDKI